jgi:Ser/Thr protein kinase RdoA (MazF antagonist)
VSAPPPETDVRRALVAGWGPAFAGASIAPGVRRGAVTHRGTLLTVRTHDGAYVAKLSENDAFARAAPFAELKAAALRHAHERGVPVVVPFPTLSGSPALRGETYSLELNELVEGVAWRARERDDEAAAEAIFALRAAFGALPPAFADALAPIELVLPVENPDSAAALERDVPVLLGEARGGGDAWSRTAERALAPLAALSSDVWTAPPGRNGVVHGDLHRDHVLLRGRPARAVAILDFDNLRVDRRTIDLAWLADQSAYPKPGSAAFDLRSPVARIREALQRRLVQRDEVPLLMPALIAYAVPIVVDIAKDILRRGIRERVWLRYLDALDVSRKLAVHDALLGAL